MSYRLGNLDGRAVLVIDDGVYDLERRSGGSFDADPMGAIERHRELGALAATFAAAEPDGPLDEARLGPPSPRPQKSFGIGLNYRTHAEESGMELPKFPLTFTKFPSCLVGPRADVVLSGKGDDYEVELVVVIGTGGRDIAEPDAWAHVAGLCVGQDISARKVQLAGQPPQFNLGKSYDTYGPCGPLLVSPDALDNADDLAITCDINGERRQDGRTSDLIFDVPTLVSYLSSILTLTAGDIIFTGTPDGVGMAQGKQLEPGDAIVSTIEGLGTMTNVCVAP